MNEQFKVFPFSRWSVTDRGFNHKNGLIPFRNVRKIIVNSDAGGFNEYLDIIKTDDTSVFLYYSTKDKERVKKVLTNAQKIIDAVNKAENDSEEFYLYCKLNGITNLSSVANVERLKLLASNNEISEQDAVSIYNEGRDSLEYRANKEEFDSLKEIEKSMENANAIFNDCRSREKYIKYCQLMRQQYEQIFLEENSGVEKINKTATNAYNYNKQQIHDWAVLGGIASGIAGTAAGVATAIHVQNKNAQIEASNQQLQNSIATLSLYAQINSLRKINSAKDAIKIYEDAENKAMSLLIQEYSKQDLLNLLNVDVKKVEVSRTRAVYVTVSITQPQDFVIFDTVKGFIDGVFKVLLKSGNEVVGQTYLPISYSGKKEIVAVCTNVTEYATSYEVELEPIYLLAIEKSNIMHYNM